MPKHTHEHTTVSGILTKDTLGTPSFLTNTTSWAIPVTDRELQHRKSKNAMLRGEKRHTKLLRLPTDLLLLSADGTPRVSLSTFCGYRDPRVTRVTPFCLLHVLTK